jgi:Uma2 family endonuclease
MAVKSIATVADLTRVPDNGKAEIVNGELILMSPTGAIPGRASGKIYRSLADYEDRTGFGFAYPDNVGFIVNLPGRQSVSPDAAFTVGSDPSMKFLMGAPLFAVEVRSEGDYGPQAEAEMRDKRADYFAAGTQVVWDVDLLSADVIRCYHTPHSDTPAVIFRRGDTAHADTILPGWSLPVNDLFSLPRRPNTQI